MVLDETPHEVAVREVAGDRPPGSAAVGARHQVRREVAVLVVVEAHVDRLGVEEVGLDVVDECGPWDTGEVADLDRGPGVTTIGAHLQQPIVGSRPQQALTPFVAVLNCLNS